MLSETISNLNVECIIFPTYEASKHRYDLLNCAVEHDVDRRKENLWVVSFEVNSPSHYFRMQLS